MRLSVYQYLTVLAFALIALFAAVPHAAAQEDRAAIHGRVIDAETGEPLPGAAVRLRELGRGAATDADGRFSFENLPARVHTVAVQFLGFAPAERRVQPAAGQRLEVVVELRSTALELPGVVVTGTGSERGIADTYRPTAVVSGRELERRLDVTIAETLRGIPGLHPVYNGPAATRPTIRGLGGDRVLVLEDGQRTGDLSTTAADHSVASDPLSAERIEVVRGPAGLLYGSNALGGVINVVRQEVPRARPTGFSGTASTSFDSVNDGIGVHLSGEVPVGSRFAARADASARFAGDTRTPEGVLPSTDLRTFGLGAGASMITDWGFAGLAYRFYDSHYGVPGKFNDEVIPGAHPNGVDIELQRHGLRFNAAHLEGFGWITALELDGYFTYYRHDEIEGRGPEGQAFLGAQFEQFSSGGSVTARHQHDIGDVNLEGAIGLSISGRDLGAGGGFTGTRSAFEIGGAAFGYEEFGWNGLRFQVGARLDARSIAPYSDRPIRTPSGDIPVTSRAFLDVSGSAALLYDFLPNWTAGVSVARAFRNPSVEELYSDGPHLADYSFDIGNPQLKSEVGHGADVFLRASQPRLNAEVGAFANFISNYIYYRPTGDLDDRFFRFPVFQAEQDDALFIGAEGRVEAEVLRGLVLGGHLSYVRATRHSNGDPLPAIPPLTGGVEARYERAGFFGSLAYDSAAPQNRVPSAFQSPVSGEGMIQPERPTAGYGLLNAGAGYRFSLGGLVHSFSLQGRNLTNEVWRDHLSRIKDVAPQPGRSLSLMYRVQF